MRFGQLTNLILPTLLLLVGLRGVPAAGTLSDDPQSRFASVPHDAELQRAVLDSPLDMLVIQREGWQETLPSFARLVVFEITGRTAIHGQDPSYTVLSMTYENDRWYTARIIPVEHPRLLEMLELKDKWVCAKDVAESPKLEGTLTRLRELSKEKGEYEGLVKLLNAVEQIYRLGREDRVFSSFEEQGFSRQQLTELLDDSSKLKELHAQRKVKGARVEDDAALLSAGNALLTRVRALSDLPGQFLVVPDPEAIDNAWVRPAALGLEVTTPITESARRFDDGMREAFLTSSAEKLRAAVAEFLPLVQKSRQYPSEGFRRAQNWYIQNNPWRWAAGIYLFAAILYGLYTFFGSRKIYWGAVAFTVAGFAFHSAAVGLRLYLKGHMPVSNMFEAITFCSWAVMLIAVFVEGFSRKAMVGVGATVIAFLLLTGASLMPLHDTRIHPLRAVLNSYWLNIHVTMMLLSYAAFAIAGFFALVYLVKSFLGASDAAGEGSLMTLQQTEEFSYRLVQLGWPILTFGITLGAVWADTAWGRYWGWDPKETWAFITWVTFTVYLHTRMVLGWRGRWSAAACLIGFVMVLITWLGVSYLPWFAGGLHTYASPS